MTDGTPKPSSTLQHVTWLKLKHVHSPNRYCVEVWRCPNIDAATKLEALCGMVNIAELKELSNAIVAKFNERMVKELQPERKANELKDIPVTLIQLDDMLSVALNYGRLEHAVNAQESLQNLTQSLLNARLVLGGSQVYRILTNTLIYHKKHGVAPKIDVRETALQLMDDIPSLADL